MKYKRLGVFKIENVLKINILSHMCKYQSSILYTSLQNI